MSAALISFLFSIGASTWIYTKFQHSNGNNTRQSITAAAVAGIIMFFVLWSIFTLILK